MKQIFLHSVLSAFTLPPNSLNHLVKTIKQCVNNEVEKYDLNMICPELPSMS